MPSATPAVALTVAGSDSGGGAGIQADLKTFRAHDVHGTSVITAITSQNTRGVSAVHAVPRAHIRSQLDAVFDDFPVAAVKTGMLGTAAITQLVAKFMRQQQPAWLVVDPVMIATSGARLLEERAVAALIYELIPLADIVTPNIPEAEVLLGRTIRKPKDFDEAAEAIRDLGAKAVLLKGGHGAGKTVIDRFYDDRGMLELRNDRIDAEGHGTGCTLAAAIAAELAKGHAPQTAVRRAVAYVHRALARGYRPGGSASRVLRH